MMNAENNLEKNRQVAIRFLKKFCDETTIDVMVRYYDYILGEPKYVGINLRKHFHIGEFFLLVCCTENAYPAKVIDDLANPENQKIMYAMKEIILSLLQLDRVRENDILTTLLNKKYEEISEII